MTDVANLLEELREGFLDDMPVRIDKIEEEVMASKNADSYDELFRMVHSLKGSAGSYNFHELTKVAHNMEDVMLSQMQNNLFNQSSTVDILLKFIDILRDTTESLVASKSAPLDIDERIESLRNQVFKQALRVLVIEPSKLYVSMIEHSVQGMSVNLTVQNDGLQALNALLLNKYDLLITSLETNRLNGDALIAALRLNHNFNKNIHAVLITSRDKEKILNNSDFDEIIDRKSVKDGVIKSIVEKLIA